MWDLQRTFPHGSPLVQVGPMQTFPVEFKREFCFSCFKLHGWHLGCLENIPSGSMRTITYWACAHMRLSCSYLNFPVVLFVSLNVTWMVNLGCSGGVPTWIHHSHESGQERVFKNFHIKFLYWWHYTEDISICFHVGHVRTSQTFAYGSKSVSWNRSYVTFVSIMFLYGSWWVTLRGFEDLIRMFTYGSKLLV